MPEELDYFQKYISIGFLLETLMGFKQSVCHFEFLDSK